MKLELSSRRTGEVAGKSIVVVGGGNTAIDVARECAQLGARERARWSTGAARPT